MQTSTSSKSATKNKVTHQLGTLQDIIESQPKLKEGLKQIGTTQKDMKNLAKFMKSNWKTVVPALAALGIGAYVLNGKMGKMKSVGKK